MNYDNILDLQNVTVEECAELYEKKNMYTIISNGVIVNFKKEVGV